MRVRIWLTIAVPVLVAAYFATGVYFVQPGERGVVRWFGRVPDAYRNVTPGLNYALPWPWCRVEKPRTTDVRRTYVGLSPDRRELIAQGDVQAIVASLPSDMLTGDVNILKVTMVVQYYVSDPAQYLFGAKEPDQLVRNTVQGVLIDALAGLPVDRALTGAKAKLQEDTRTRSQALLDRYGAGVLLTAANLESIDPPRAIIAAFQDVVSAKKDGERAVDRAVAEQNRILARARGDAVRIREESLGYAQTRVSQARGEAASFLSVLTEYRKNPKVFRQRLLLETLETILPDIRTYILDQKPTDPHTRVKIIETERE